MLWLVESTTGNLVLTQILGQAGSHLETPEVGLANQTFLANVIARQSPLYVQHIQQESDFSFRELALEQDWQSALALPIQDELDTCMGVMMVCSTTEERRFTDRDHHLARALLQHIAMVLTPTNSADAKPQSRLQSEITQATSLIVSQSHDLGQILDNIVRMVIGLFQADACALYLASLNGQSLSLACHQGLPPDVVERAGQLSLGQGFSGKVLASGKSVTSPDIVGDPRGDDIMLPPDGLQSLIVVPINTDERIVGTLAISTAHERLFTNDDIELLEGVGDQIGRAIAREQSADQYRRLFQDAKDPMFIIDPDRHIIDANHQASSITGFTHQELCGYELMQLVSDPDKAEQARDRAHRLVQGEDTEIIEVAIRHKNSSTFLIESNLTPIYDSAHQLIGIQVIWCDITARNRAALAVERRNQQLNTLLRLSQVVIHPTEHDDLLSLVMERAADILESHICVVHLLMHDTELRELLVFPPPDRFTWESADQSHLDDPVIREVISKGQVKMANHIYTMPEPLSLSPAFGQGVRHVLSMPIKSQADMLGVISVARCHEGVQPYNQGDREYLELLANILALDFEHRRLAEAQFKQQAAATTLEQVSVLGAFLAHKVPSVLGTVDWAVQQLDKRLQSTAPDVLIPMQNLRDSARKAEHLIKQCRSLGRPLFLRPEAVSLNTLVQQALQPVERLQSVQTEVLSLELPPVHANPALLSEILEGVLQNALDAMPNGGTLSIRGDLTADRATVRLHIQDTGSGIISEALPHLFTTPFYTSRHDGTGLGLWLSRLYLRSIDGDIWVADTSPQGSTFTLELPTVARRPAVREKRAAPHEDAPPHDPIVSPAPEALKVLIVDDQINWQDRLSLPFIDQGLDVLVATNYDEAIRLLEQHDFIAFVVDVCLNDQDLHNIKGLDVVDQIRNRHLSGPVSVLSVYKTSLRCAEERCRNWRNINVLDKLDAHLDAALIAMTIQAIERVRQDDGQPTILIVEDEHSWQNMLTDLCQHAGFKVTQVFDIRDALHQLQILPLRPSLAIIDLELRSSAPQQDYEGLQLLSALHDQGIYTIVVSGNIPFVGESLIGRPEIRDLVDKEHFRADENYGTDVFIPMVRATVDHAEAALHAEGQLPEQQERLRRLSFPPLP